ncbi:hypothetical protein ABZ848_49140 [Streptomyces sp. NPDC047081]|uniref:hypothetical protein n=1 Tax=Streptomyces sp. NPDC047081 TaxID=3154706 RepID=UPI0033FB91FF
MPRSPQVFDLVNGDLAAGSLRSTCVRGQNFCVMYTEFTAGETVTETVADEYLVLLAQAGATLRITVGTGETVLNEPGLVVVPPGTSHLSSDQACPVLRVFSARNDAVLASAVNRAAYTVPDRGVAPLPQAPPTGPAGSVRVYPMSSIPSDSGRFGRIFRTEALMVNWFPPQEGPRDPEQLSPHVHEDFEQASVTLAGDYIHHFRTPWTPRLSEWRDDVSIRCSSPSVAVIPPGIIHTTRAVGEGTHHLVDVFAPPRIDFLERGWVLNAREYTGTPDQEPRGEFVR